MKMFLSTKTNKNNLVNVAKSVSPHDIGLNFNEKYCANERFVEEELHVIINVRRKFKSIDWTYDFQ